MCYGIFTHASNTALLFQPPIFLFAWVCHMFWCHTWHRKISPACKVGGGAQCSLPSRGNKKKKNMHIDSCRSILQTLLPRLDGHGVRLNLSKCRRDSNAIHVANSFRPKAFGSSEIFASLMISIIFLSGICLRPL